MRHGRAPGIDKHRMKLLHRVALITGGSRGIGRAIALGFAREGAKVCIASRNEGQLKRTAEEIHALGEQELAVRCDVTDTADVARLVDQAHSRFGAIDILVNNAGGTYQRAPLVASDGERWRKTIELNLLGVYNCCRAVVPHMQEAGSGKVINIGSGAGHRPRAGNSAYDIAKAALSHLTRTLAMEVWEDGVDVNELIPGPVYTELTREIFPPPGEAPAIAESERVKLPEDCVELALYCLILGSKNPRLPGDHFSSME